VANPVILGAREVRNHSEADWIGDGAHDDWNRTGRLLGGKRRRRSPGHDDVDRHRCQLRRQNRVAVVSSLCETGFEPEILPLDISVLPQLLRKFLQRRQRRQHADAHNLRLLRRRCERPRDRYAPDKRDDLATIWLIELHSISTTRTAAEYQIGEEPSADIGS
jgi:hypothetical protein